MRSRPPRRRRPRLSEPTVDLLAAADPVVAVEEAHDSGRLVRLRTSGSTTAPRWVLRTTDSWVVSFDHVSELAGLDAASRVWVPGPMTASMNLFAAVHARFVGAPVVDVPEDATHAVLTPAQLDTLLEAPWAHGLTVLVAGDHLTRRAHARAVHAGLRVHHYYGAAELSFVAWGRHADDLRLFPGVEAAVRDGELWARSPYLCRGYAGPDGPLRRDADGFATVGDRGVLDGDRVVVHGRPAAVTTGGATVELADVERELRAVANGDVVVLAVPHGTLGSVLTAVVTDPADHRPLRTAAEDRLSPAARPRVWHHSAALPLTPEGKVDRPALLALVTGDQPPRRLI